MLLAWHTAAELPVARLTGLYPPGGQSGHSVVVTLTGSDLDGADQLHFVDSRIAARRVKPTTVPKGAADALQFEVSIGADVPARVYDVRAVGRFGVSNPRSFAVDDEPEAAAPVGNTTAVKAMELRLDTAAFAVAEASADQFFRVPLKKGQAAYVSAEALCLDSKMEPAFVVTGPDGRDVIRSRAGAAMGFEAAVSGDYLISVHDVIYRGGAEFFYRLAVMSAPSMDRSRSVAAAAFADDGCLSLARGYGPDFSRHDAVGEARPIIVPCVVDGEFRRPRFRDWYQFDASAGSAYTIEVVSERLGGAAAVAAPAMVVQRASADGKLVDVSLPSEQPGVGIAEFPAPTRDPAYRLTVKDAGSYRMMVRNLYAVTCPYHLIVRRTEPDFALVVVPASPLPEPKDSREVPIWSTLLRPDGTTPIKIAVVRRDGFDGDIALHVTGLPDGVTAGEAVIGHGESSGEIMLTAREDAKGWVGPIKVIGTSLVDGRMIGHEARSGTVVDSTYDAEHKVATVWSRATDEFVVAVSGTDKSAVTVASTQPVVMARAGQKAAIPLKLTRRGEFTTPIGLRVSGHPAFAAAVEQAVDLKSDAASFSLDLAALNTPAGRYVLHMEGQATVKFAGKDVTVGFYSAPFVLEVKPLPPTTTTTQPVK